MTILIRAITIAVILLAPLPANAVGWSFQGRMNVEQPAATHALTLPDPYFGDGIIIVTLDTVSGEFTSEFSFAGLSGPTFAAHFHEAESGMAGDIVVLTPVASVTAGTFSGAVILADLPDALTALTGDGSFGVGAETLWYHNTHTPDNTAGELRAQLFVSSAPLPGAVWMFGSALCALFGLRHSR